MEIMGKVNPLLPQVIPPVVGNCNLILPQFVWSMAPYIFRAVRDCDNWGMADSDAGYALGPGTHL